MTEKQKNFCENYIANGYNAREAYYSAFGENARKNKQPSYPYTLLKNPEIKEYIEQRRNEIYNSLNIDALRVVQEIAEMAFADKGDEVYGPQIKIKALDLLSKNLGLQTQKVEQKDVIEVSIE